MKSDLVRSRPANILHLNKKPQETSQASLYSIRHDLTANNHKFIMIKNNNNNNSNNRGDNSL